MNDLVLKNRLKLFFFSVIIIVNTQLLKAQITIKESVQIKSRNINSELNPGHQKLAGAGEFYYPILRDIGFGKYLILKSGELKFYVPEAITYGFRNLNDNPFIYTV